jgi:hypothetical protein
VCPFGSNDKSVETESCFSSVGFEVHYIAENHENLHHVLVFLTITGATPGVEIEAEVLPTLPNVDEGDRLLVRNGPNTSPPLLLPARTFPGKKEVKPQGEHYEIKLQTSPFTPVSHPEPLPLLDATQLTSLSPMNFTCSSCSLPLVHASSIKTYRDLPSEHWEELVDAWMCHGDQHLHEQIVKRGFGFWPEPGQALVGGSYILFEASSMVPNNLCLADETKVSLDSTPTVAAIMPQMAWTNKKTVVGYPPTVVCFEGCFVVW